MKRIDHTTDCPYEWCSAGGALPEEHTSLCEPYVPATLSIGADRGSLDGAAFPAAGFGVSWDRTDDPTVPPAVSLHIVDPRHGDNECDFTLSEAVRLRAELDRVIGIVTGLHRFAMSGGPPKCVHPKCDSDARWFVNAHGCWKGLVCSDHLTYHYKRVGDGLDKLGGRFFCADCHKPFFTIESFYSRTVPL